MPYKAWIDFVLKLGSNEVKQPRDYAPLITTYRYDYQDAFVLHLSLAA